PIIPECLKRTMKWPEPRVFAHGVTELAESVEKEFFRIERENRLLGSAINGLIAGAAVAIVAWMAVNSQEGDILLFACLGSSAASVVFAPIAKSNSLRSILLAYIMSGMVCCLIYPFRHYELMPIYALCFLAVSFSTFLMRCLDAMHPAAIGSAMAFLIYKRDLQTLLSLSMAICGLLVIVKVLAYIYLEELMFKDFHREFRKDYYGDELCFTFREPEVGDATDGGESASSPINEPI
ncbi:MAG: hypothetical protein CMJ78_24210, partial [Planctomycetaceae bacterium]|nr:hypothetical protein [Planctomycetaceae bacterium]